MKVKEIVGFLSSVAPPSLQEGYDNAGLIVGDMNAEVSGILICLDSIESVIDEAIEKKCNMVVAHHPIVFQGLKSFNGKNYVERVIIKAIRNNISVYAAHTNLDNVFMNGVNAKIAEKLNLVNTRVLAPKNGLLRKLNVFVPSKDVNKVSQALFDAGAGNIGNYSECSFLVNGKGSFKANEGANPVLGKVGNRHYEEEQKIEVVFEKYKQNKIVNALINAHPYEEVAYDVIALENKLEKVGSGIVGDLKVPEDAIAFLKRVKRQMRTECIRYTGLGKKKIKRIAVCGGAGSFLLNNAISANADIFITADYKYHQFFDAENRIIIADIGHYESEQYTIELFYELLTQKFCNFAIYCTEINTNPINYI
jgi:dinuclear metal center YbgI/SA1388 family protein